MIRSIPLYFVLFFALPGCVSLTTEGDTPLHIAALNNDYDSAASLITKGANVNVKDEHKQTPLHIAALHNALEMAAPLIDKGADVNAKDKKGQTPLDLARKQKNWKLAQLLETRLRE